MTYPPPYPPQRPGPGRGVSSTFVTVVIAAVVVLSGVVAVVMWPSKVPATLGASAPTTSTTTSTTLTTTTTTSTPPPAGQCAYTDSDRTPGVKYVGKPPAPEKNAPGTVNVVIKTNQGDIPVTLVRTAGPCAVQSTLFLATNKFYDNTPCHRLTSGGLSVLQCGDPTGSGSGGPGYQYDDKLPTDLKPAAGGEDAVVYTRGLIAMANAGPGTNGSQFFLVYADSPLPPAYIVIGTFEPATVDKIAAGGITPGDNGPTDGSPANPVVIQQVVVS